MLSHGLSGQEIKAIGLGDRGYEVSGAVLRRLMPKMRPNQWYQVRSVIRAHFWL